MNTPLDERGLPRGWAFKPEFEVTPREASQAAPSRVVIVDVRTAPEWEIARVAGSVHIPLDELERRADEIESEGRDVLVLCHHGVRSLKGALALRALGIAGAKSIAGGIEAWSLGVDSRVPRYERSGGVCRLVPSMP